MSVLLLVGCGSETPVAEATDCSDSSLPGLVGAAEDCDALQDTALTKAEGGYIRISVQEGVDAFTDTQAVFYKDQLPEQRPIMGKVVEGNCFDPANSGDVLSGASYLNAQSIADSRTYLNLGSYINLEVENRVYALQVEEDTSDPSTGVYHDFIYRGNYDATQLLLGTSYRIANLPIESGVDLLGTRHDSAEIKMPNRVEMAMPDMSVGVVVPSTGDWELAWAQANDPDEAVAFVSLVDERSYQAVVTCIIAPNFGQFILPQSVLSRAPDSGLMVFGVVSHRAHVLDGRRVDLLGRYSQAQRYVRF